MKITIKPAGYWLEKPGEKQYIVIYNWRDDITVQREHYGDDHYKCLTSWDIAI